MNLIYYRGQVVEVGYGPQRIFISSWRDMWWNIRCGRLGDLAQASLDQVVNEKHPTAVVGGITAQRGLSLG